jgi:hypothetical protein
MIVLDFIAYGSHLKTRLLLNILPTRSSCTIHGIKLATQISPGRHTPTKDHYIVISKKIQRTLMKGNLYRVSDNESSLTADVFIPPTQKQCPIILHAIKKHDSLSRKKQL